MTATTERLCLSLEGVGEAARTATTVLEAPSSSSSVDNDDLNESLIPTWDDAEDVVQRMFDDDDDDSVSSCRHENDNHNEDCSCCDAENSSCCCSDGVVAKDGDNEEDKNIGLQLPGLIRQRSARLAHLRSTIPVISSSSEDSSGVAEEGENCNSSSEEEEEMSHDEDGPIDTDNLHHHLDEESCSNKRIHTNNAVEPLHRFSLPKQLLQQKSINPSPDSYAASTTMKSSLLPVDLSRAVKCQVPGEVCIRAELLQRGQMPQVLDLIRSFAHPTKRLVLKGVHKGAIVEATLFYLLQLKNADGSSSLSSLSYSGSWISPSLIDHLATSENGLEELELGLSLYPKAKRSIRRRPARQTPPRTLSRHLQRLEELEEALAANTSLRTLCFLPTSHLKVTEGLLWAASCHAMLEQVVVSVPVCMHHHHQNAQAENIENGILLFEGLAEVIRQVSSLQSLSLLVDPHVGASHKAAEEPTLAAGEWEEIAKALGETKTLQKLQLEFENIQDTPFETLGDMTTNLMEGIANNSSLEFLELLNFPKDCAMDIFYSIHTRTASWQKISIRQSPEIVSSLACLEDDEERGAGWWSVKTLQVDQISLSQDLDGLQSLVSSGKLGRLVVTDRVTKRNGNRLMEALRGNKLQGLEMEINCPTIFSELHSDTLQSLVLRGNGRHSVSSGEVVTLLTACPALRHLSLTNNVLDVGGQDGDSSKIWQQLEAKLHPLETLDIEYEEDIVME